MATQGCPCGPLEVKRYLARVSGPLLDRVDIQVSMPPVTFRDLQGAGLPAGERSGEVARRVSGARERQRSRLAGRDGVPHVNARLSIREVRDSCRLDRAGAALLRRAMEQIGLSARAYHRILRVARTVADLEGAESIAPAHVAEAIQYRSLDRLKAAGASLNP